MGRLRRAVRVLRYRGFAYLGYLVGGYLLPRIISWMLFESRLSRSCQRLVTGLARISLRASRGRRREVRQRPAAAPGFLSGRSWLPAETFHAAAEQQHGEPVALGRIDNDGRALALCGALPCLDEVDRRSFVARYRYGLDLVLDGDAVLIRKDFRGDRRAFLREWLSLAALAETPGSPAVHHVDEERLHLYKSFVPGRTLRQLLVDASARILSVETEEDPDLAGLSPPERIEAVWARGRERFADAFAPQLLATLEDRLDAIHRCGVTSFSLTFGNVVVHEATGDPWFIDFDAAHPHRCATGFAFAASRDRDRDIFNRIYGRDLLTERSARALLKRAATPYSPIDLGRGLASRGFWSIDSGTGRWELLIHRVLKGLIEGRRILDLGSHHGLMPLLMLAAGAREVIAVEESPALVTRARHLHRLFEWRYLRSFNLDLRCADRWAILDGGRERFDVVTAFCSLSSLERSETTRVVRRAAELAPILVLQAEIDTRAEAAGNTAEKSSVAVLRAVLEEHGFPRVEVVAPAPCSRPLLIGRREGVEPLPGKE